MKKLTILLVLMLMMTISASAQQQSNFQRGWSAYFDKQDYDAALTYLTKAIEEDSQNGQAWMLLGDIYLRKDKLDDALDACKKALALLEEDQGPQRAFVYITSGDVYSKRGNHNRAIVEYEQAANANPNYANNFMKVAEEYITIEKYSKALEWCEKAIEVDGEAAYPMVTKGRIYLEQGRRDKKKREEYYNKAMLACKLCIKTHPDYSWGYSTRAEVNYEQGNLDAALEDVSKAYAMNSGNAEAWSFIIKMAEKHPHQLLAKLKAQYKEYPDNKDMPYIIGIANEVDHNYAEAIEYYQKALDNKADYNVVNRIAYSFARMGLHEEAIPLMRYQANRNNITENQRSIAYYNLVDYMLAAERSQQAINLADSLVGEFPTTNFIYHLRANARWKNHDYQGAIDDYNVALHLDKNDRSAYSLRARMYYLLGMTKEMKADFNHVLQLDSAKTAETVFAYCYLGQKSKAQKALKKYEGTDDGATDYYNLACAYSLLGNTDKALELLAKSIETGQQLDFTHVANDPDLEALHKLPEYTALITLHKNRIAKDKKQYKGTALAMLKKIQKENVPASVRDAFMQPRSSTSGGGVNDAYRRMRDAFRK